MRDDPFGMSQITVTYALLLPSPAPPPPHDFFSALAYPSLRRNGFPNPPTQSMHRADNLRRRFLTSSPGN